MARTRPTDGYAERIKEALQRGDRALGSVRALHRALEADERYADMRGVSYSGVRQYVDGQIRRPRIAVLRAMAAVMGVRSDWLCFETGGMTEADEEHRLLQEKLAEIGELEARELHASVLRAIGGAPVDYEPRFWTPAVAEAANRLDVEPGRVGRVLSGPLEALDIDPGRMSESAFNDYVLSMLPALLALAPERTAQAPYRNPNKGGNDA